MKNKDEDSKILKNNKGIIGIRKIILYLILSGTITVGFLSSVSWHLIYATT